MFINFNNKVLKIAPLFTLKALLAEHSVIASGMAVSVNDCVVPQSLWHNTTLYDNDQVYIFQAIAGG